MLHLCSAPVLHTALLRIFPLYYTMLATTALLAIPPVHETIAWHIPYLSNIYFAWRGGFHGDIGHFWSLAVEEQFYLLWPWIILLVPKHRLLMTIIIFIGIAPLFRMICTISHINQVAIWVLPPNAFDALCLGALLAYRSYHAAELRVFKTHSVSFFLALGVLMTIALQIVSYVDASGLMVSALADTGKALLLTALVAAAAHSFKGWVGKALEAQPLVYVGRISYGIYLIHAFMPGIV